MGESLPPVKYPPLKCKYCGVLVPQKVLEGKSIDVEIWASYHVKAHRDARKELAKEKLPWSAGLIPVEGEEHHPQTSKLPQPMEIKATAVFMEMSDWFCKYRKPMTVKEVRPIATRYFSTGEELLEFYEYLVTSEGQKKLRRELRDAARRHGISVPPEEEFITSVRGLLPQTIGSEPPYEPAPGNGGKLVPALKPFEPYHFAEYVLRYNKFSDFEIPIYSGLSGLNPLRVPDRIWAEVLDAIDGEFVKQGELYVVKTPEMERPPYMRAAPSWRDVASTEPKKPISKTRVSSLGYQELEIPVAKAVEALVDESPWSSGFHGSLNQRWTIVFRGKVSDRAVSAAEIAGLDVSYREAPKGSGQILTEISLSDVGVTEIEKATEVFNRFAELYEGLAPATIPTQPSPPSPKEELEFVSDSQEYIPYTIEQLGLRDQIDKAFTEAIERARAE